MNRRILSSQFGDKHIFPRQNPEVSVQKKLRIRADTQFGSDSELNSVAAEQFACRINGIHAGFVLDRRKFLFALDLIGEAILLQFHQIECQRLKFKGIRLLRSDCIAVFCSA